MKGRNPMTDSSPYLSESSLQKKRKKKKKKQQKLENKIKADRASNPVLEMRLSAEKYGV